MSVPPKMSLISLSGHAIIFQKHSLPPLKRTAPAEEGSEQRMNYELHMPSPRGHKPFSTPTWSPSPSNKIKKGGKKKKTTQNFLAESKVTIVDPTIKRVLSLFSVGGH